MSIRAIHETFQAAAKEPIRCVAARMRYTDDRKAQILEFDVVHGGTQRTVVSDPIPHGESLHVAAAKLAAAVAAGTK